MKTTSIPGLSVGQFNGAGIDLAMLGLNPANPAADRVKDGLAALRQKAPIKATKSPIAIRQRVPALTPKDAMELGRCMVSSQFSQGIGIPGKKVALEIAVRLADTLDAFHGYLDMLKAVEVDLSKPEEYVDERCWAATPRYIQQLVVPAARADYKAAIRQVEKEIENLTAMLNEVDRIGGTALELFERRRMQREGMRPRAIDKAIAEMKADGRIPMQEGGQQRG